MAVTKPIPIRLDNGTISRLRVAARAMGSNLSAVVRFSVFNQLPEIESGVVRLRKNDRKPTA